MNQIITAVDDYDNDKENVAQTIPNNDKSASTNSTTAVVEWAVIRPGVLVESNHVTGYSIHPTSPRGPFSDGSVSRINVAHLMVELILKDDLWQEYKYQMPIILNKDNEELGTATTK